MKRTNHIPEQKIIDFLSGELSENEAKQIQSHLYECEKCMKLAEHWRQLLDQSHSQPVQPPKSLKEKMWKVVEKKKLKKSRGVLKPVATVLSFAVAIALFLLIVNDRPEMEKPYEVVKNDDIPFETFHATPNTKQWDIVPTMYHRQINGNLWVNRDTNEMFLEVDGLPQYRNRDYQLWIIYSNDDVEGELLILQNGSSRILFQGIDVERFKLIKASVEPKGGSTRQTGPDTFFVDFEH